MKRRDFLRVAGGSATAGAATAAASGTAAAQPSFGGWMSNVGNYDGVSDQTGKSEVTVDVGAEGNGGNYAFSPAAIQVDPGTKVTWQWTGKGNSHNVVAQEGASFQSELASEAGHTFSHTFESEGVVKYYCQPHQPLGMKGVVVVGAMPSSGGGGGGGEGGGGGGGEKDLEELGVPIQAHFVGAATILAILVTLVFVFYVLKYGESPHTGTGRGE